MKTIRFFLLFTFIVVCSTLTFAQSTITIDASQLYTSFKFSDSQSNNLNAEYSGVYNSSYGIGFRYLTEFGLIIKPGVGLRKGGANLVYDEMNYSWELQYLEGKLGVGYIYITNRINPYFMASGYYGYLLGGTQVINNEDFNIKESELLNNMDYGLIFSPGVEFKLSPIFSTYIEFNYIWGLKNIEMDETQNASNLAYGLTLGLSLSISK